MGKGKFMREHDEIAKTFYNHFVQTVNFLNMT